ncbi:MAG: OmpH family outer membrane protein [Marinilabiliaceae bacterium]|nr:OmpH family outer membrane protein [Bacteroidales bacterium]MDD5816627.1 OmpH family outer membrane protein [Bacteroidales bacterium]MDY4521070.1 OmpH family outer membrane protein [Bacteroidales bacterium]
MKQIFCTLSLVVALMTSCQQANQAPSVANVQSDSAQFGIAYVNTDSLLTGYDYAVKMSEQLNDKAERSRTDFNEKARVFQQEMVEFQRKVQNNGFLSMERAQKEQARLQQREQELQELNQKLSAELMQEQGRLTTELADTVSKFLKEYGQGRYNLILSNNMGDNVLYAAEGVDITAEVVAALNERYAKSQK